MLKIADFGGKFREPGAAPEAVGEVVSGSVSGSRPASGRPVTNTRLDSSFKINDSLRQESQRQPVIKVSASVESSERVEAREAFDETGVVAAFEKYVAEHSPEQTVVFALRTHRPLVEGEDVVLPVDNQLQVDKLEAVRKQLQNVLMKCLNNGFVTLNFKLFDAGSTQEEKRFFTSGEKFEHFVQLNPAVADLKRVFGLELE